MTTSHTTFESDLRERLLDVVYGQWCELGVPFSTPRPPATTEVIDPEALLWCSLEFSPSDERLWEGVQAWLRVYGGQVNQRRVNQVAKPGDPRTHIWWALMKPASLKMETPTEPCHGLDSVTELENFCASIKKSLQRAEGSKHAAGTPLEHPSSGMLRARDLLGSDLRHLMLVYLLANPGGSRLKDVAQFSKCSYRSVSETAARWEAAKALVVKHGYCRLVDPESWHALLQGQLRKAVVVDWFAILEALIDVLRAAARCRRKGLSPDSPVIGSYCRKACDVLDSASREEGRGRSLSIACFRKVFRLVKFG